MILARDAITISHLRDIEATYWFWQLKSSTAAAPSRPTAAQAAAFIANHSALPTGWALSEPAYTSGSTNSLYKVELTEYTDETGSWSEVSKDSAYEAAKAAYNKSVQAEATANQADEKASRSEELIIGTQTAATGAWTGKSNTITALYDGLMISYWLPFAGSGVATLNLTLKGGGTTGAIACYYGGTSRLTTHYGAGSVIRLCYRANVTIGTGTYTGWWADANYDSNSSYTQAAVVKAGTNGIRGYTLIMKDTDDTWTCLYKDAWKGTGTGKTAYTGGLKLGKVKYSAGAGAQTSNSSLDTYYNYKSGVVTSTIYDAYPVDLRYTTNCGTTLTASKPVYLVGTIKSDGLFYLDTSAWWTQTRPTSEDGKTYIYLGEAQSTYQVWLASENTAYQYYEGQFRTLEEIASLEAEKVATSYLTDLSNGVFVHAEGTPENPTASTAKGVRITDDVDIIRNGKSVAAYGEDVRIGRTDESRALIDYHSMQLIDKEGVAYFHVSDLRDSTGKYQMTETFAGDGETKIFDVSLSRIGDFQITVNDVITSDFTSSLQRVTFNSAPEKGSKISISYTTTKMINAYTFGDRDEGTVGAGSLALGHGNIASGSYSTAIGVENTASGLRSFAVGQFSTARGENSIAMGRNSKATQKGAFALNGTANGEMAFALNGTANEAYAVSEGYRSYANGECSHAEGNNTEANGECSHAEGNNTEANKFASHAEGCGTVVNGECSHAEGYGTYAVGDFSHAEGRWCYATYDYSHAGGYCTHSNGMASVAIGKYNLKRQVADGLGYGYPVCIGNGTSETERSDALTVGWDGNVYIALDTNAASGSTDGDLYAAINALGWASDVIK